MSVALRAESVLKMIEL